MKKALTPTTEVIRVGDCAELMPDYPGADTVDLLLTDPPYLIWANLGLKGDKIGQGSSYAGGYVAHERWMFKAYPTLKQTANVVVFEHPKNLEVVLAALRRNGLHILGTGVWVVPFRLNNSNNRRLLSAYDVWVWAAKDPKQYYYAHAGLPDAFYETQKGIDRAQDQNGGFIPGQKPIPMLRRMIRALCPEDGFVFDPFLGSGSTGRAAREEGRRWAGIEIGDQNLRTIRAKTLADVGPLEGYGSRPESIARPRGGRALST